VPGVDLVYVATDDDRIREVAESFGATVLMTPESCLNGTERCAAALAQLPDDVGIIVNLQGDAPLTPAGFIESLVVRLAGDPAAMMATPAIRCSAELYARLVTDQREGRVGGTTVVSARDGNALYFSKRVIPYVPAGPAGT
jgi:3-deoxy-manno-octulosonate cytidylyltransferase (CMP-KDO synthetase)